MKLRAFNLKKTKNRFGTTSISPKMLMGIALGCILLGACSEDPIDESIVNNEQLKAAKKVKPLFRNSIVSTDIDFIRKGDPNAYKSMEFLGRKKKEMPDSRSEILIDKEAFVFKLTFSDKSTVEVWAHSSFKSHEKAKKQVVKLHGPLGKLPGFMRKKIKHVVVHKGNEVAFAENGDQFFVLYSQNMDTRINNNDLEETVFHESVHATLEDKYKNDKTWLNAQKNDKAFITEYAQENPEKEDLPETAIFAYTYKKHPNRLNKKTKDWMKKNIKERLAFFDTVFK